VEVVVAEEDEVAELVGVEIVMEEIQVIMGQDIKARVMGVGAEGVVLVEIVEEE
jgi:hypothetical protein